MRNLGGHARQPQLDLVLARAAVVVVVDEPGEANVEAIVDVQHDRVGPASHIDVADRNEVPGARFRVCWAGTARPVIAPVGDLVAIVIETIIETTAEVASIRCAIAVSIELIVGARTDIASIGDAVAVAVNAIVGAWADIAAIGSAVGVRVAAVIEARARIASVRDSVVIAVEAIVRAGAAIACVGDAVAICIGSTRAGIGVHAGIRRAGVGWAGIATGVTGCCIADSCVGDRRIRQATVDGGSIGQIGIAAGVGRAIHTRISLVRREQSSVPDATTEGEENHDRPEAHANRVSRACGIRKCSTGSARGRGDSAITRGRRDPNLHACAGWPMRRDRRL